MWGPKGVEAKTICLQGWDTMAVYTAEEKDEGSCECLQTHDNTCLRKCRIISVQSQNGGVAYLAVFCSISWSRRLHLCSKTWWREFAWIPANRYLRLDALRGLKCAELSEAWPQLSLGFGGVWEVKHESLARQQDAPTWPVHKLTVNQDQEKDAITTCQRVSGSWFIRKVNHLNHPSADMRGLISCGQNSSSCQMATEIQWSQHTHNDGIVPLQTMND